MHDAVRERMYDTDGICTSQLIGGVPRKHERGPRQFLAADGRWGVDPRHINYAQVFLLS